MSRPPLVFENEMTVLAILSFLGNDSLNSSVLFSPWAIKSIKLLAMKYLSLNYNVLIVHECG
jgi:hypothetical protein